MKRLFLWLLPLLVAFGAQASSFHAHIFSIDLGTRPGEDHIIKFTHGRVALLGPNSTADLISLQANFSAGDPLEVEVDESNSLVAFQVKRWGRGEKPEAPVPLEAVPFSYEPSVVSLATASSAFTYMRRDYQNESQCYNRAHIWAYEEFKRTGLKSLKLFMFFTNRYIRNYRYFWWFHVTPATMVGGEMMTLDRRYTRGPLGTHTWSNIFVYSHRSCPTVYRWSDYRDNQESEDCYHMPVSMYFWQPRDMVTEERTGSAKSSFLSQEVNYAYGEAF